MKDLWQNGKAVKTWGSQEKKNNRWETNKNLTVSRVFCTYSVNEVMVLLLVSSSLYTTCCVQTDSTLSHPLARDNLHWNSHRQHLLFYSYSTSSLHNTTTNAAFASLDQTTSLNLHRSHLFVQFNMRQHEAETDETGVISCTPSRFLLLFQSLMSYI